MGDHVEYADDCQRCHHHSSQLEQAPPCRECHTRPFTPKGEKLLGLVDAYHAQCMACHVDMGGPTQCDGCHAVKAGAGTE